MKIGIKVKFGFSSAIVCDETLTYWILCKRTVVGEDWEIIKYAKEGMPKLEIIE
jgi:hypothetical protein